VVELVVERAQNPRKDYEDAHFDEMMAAVVDRYGTEPVRTVIHYPSSTTIRSGPPRIASKCATSTAFVSGRQPTGSSEN
jgi:hypothetical protein